MNNEIQKLHFEVKRLNVQLDQLRAQMKHIIGVSASLRTDLNSLLKPNELHEKFKAEENSNPPNGT